MGALSHAQTKACRLRLAGRLAILVAAVILGWPPAAHSWTTAILPALSPYVASGSALALRCGHVLMLLALPTLALVLLVPRGFCRYGCPTGLLQEWAARLRRSETGRANRGPVLGPWILAITLGGAGLGYPWLLCLDPLAIFSGFLSAWRQPLTLAALMAGPALPGLLLLAWVRPNLWCHRLCPLGAAQDGLALLNCSLRKACRQAPVEPSPGPWSRTWLARRGFLGACAGAVGALFMVRTGRSAPRPLRPPGAVDEARFSGVCVRCGNCAQACPPRIIAPDLGAHGLASLLTPVLRFDRDYCREDCCRCDQVCPSGALARLSLIEKRRSIIGWARVDLDCCLLAEGKECTACIRSCPFQALTIQAGPGGFDTMPRLDASRCNGCGACVSVCPTRPRRAIAVVPRDSFPA